MISSFLFRRPRGLDKAGLILALLVASGSAFASQLVDNLLAGQNQTVVVFGTSLTATGQWVSDTRTWLNSLNPGNASVTLINSGQSGRASRTGLAVLNSAVIAKNPDTVFIEFSVNDAFAAYATSDIDYNISISESKANLNTMIDRLQAALPDVKIILQTMNPAWDAPNGNQSGSKRPDLLAYYEAYREVSVTRGLLLIDHTQNWLALQSENLALFKDYIPDGVHPGQSASTRVTFPEIKEALTAAPVPEPAKAALTAGGVALFALLTGRRRRISA